MCPAGTNAEFVILKCVCSPKMFRASYARSSEYVFNSKCRGTRVSDEFEIDMRSYIIRHPGRLSQTFYARSHNTHTRTPNKHQPEAHAIRGWCDRIKHRSLLARASRRYAEVSQSMHATRETVPNFGRVHALVWLESATRKCVHACVSGSVCARTPLLSKLNNWDAHARSVCAQAKSFWVIYYGMYYAIYAKINLQTNSRVLYISFWCKNNRKCPYYLLKYKSICNIR